MLVQEIVEKKWIKWYCESLFFVLIFCQNCFIKFSNFLHYYFSIFLQSLLIIQLYQECFQELFSEPSHSLPTWRVSKITWSKPKIVSHTYSTSLQIGADHVNHWLQFLKRKKKKDKESGLFWKLILIYLKMKPSQKNFRQAQFLCLSSLKMEKKLKEPLEGWNKLFLMKKLKRSFDSKFNCKFIYAFLCLSYF